MTEPNRYSQIIEEIFRSRFKQALGRMTDLMQRVLLRDLDWESRRGGLRKSFTITADGLVEVAKLSGVRLRWLTHGNGPMVSTPEWESIPVVMQPCQDAKLILLGTITARGKSVIDPGVGEDDFIDSSDDALMSLIVNIREAAPTGTTRIYNLQASAMESFGGYYFKGTADAYKDPERLPLDPKEFTAYGRRIGKLKPRKRK